MARSARSLLEQIDDGALDSRTPLADVLRKCVALGGRAGSTELRDWARRELDGYVASDDLPAYRKVSAVIAIDGANLHYHWTGQQISPSDLPDFARDDINQEAPILQGVGELEKLARSKDTSIKLQHTGMPDLVRYMNGTMDLNGTIHSMYWQISPNAIHGVVETIRTALVALVAEMRAAGVRDEPTAEAANQAVNVVIHKSRRSTIMLNTTQSAARSAYGRQEITNVVPPVEESMIPAWIRGPWGFAVGAATIVAGATGTAVWLDWNPLN